MADELGSAADASAETPSAAVFLFRSLADPARLTILRHLALGEHRVVDLTAHLGLAQSTTSAHLACLKGCGLVAARTVGRSSIYSLAVPAELVDLLGAAERLLGATGDAVALCSTNHAVAQGPTNHAVAQGPTNHAVAQGPTNHAVAQGSTNHAVAQGSDRSRGRAGMGS